MYDLYTQTPLVRALIKALTESTQYMLNLVIHTHQLDIYITDHVNKRDLHYIWVKHNTIQNHYNSLHHYLSLHHYMSTLGYYTSLTLSLPVPC